MRIGKRMACVLLSMALCLVTFFPQPVEASAIYFTSVNDNLLPLTSDSMPMWFGGMLYVPYGVFDQNVTGQNLGVSSSYNRTKNVVRVYNLDALLTFDINSGKCWDDFTGKEYLGRAILQNGKPYVSLRTVCEVFKLTYSYTAMEQGILVRVKSDSVVLSDSQFIDAAQNLIDRRLKEYNQSIAPSKPSVPSSGSTTEEPSQEGETEISNNVDTYLSFLCKDVSGLNKIFTALQGQHEMAVFFLTPELIREQGDWVRRLLGQGHSIGIWARGVSQERVQDQITWGNMQLEEQAMTRTTLVFAEREFRTQLEGKGYVAWKNTFTLVPSDSVGPNYFAGAVSQRLKGRSRTTYLTFEGGDNTARVLSAVLRQLEKDRFIVRIPLETRI